ncbi:hypothetical protein ACH5RR_002820 [Cinchona calisaya]|uniref:TF-B3 domain-containing protein n=1 Tax=Cinchona calisaya TaxID=153742 RepID=A0ABD3AT21_9GENT
MKHRRENDQECDANKDDSKKNSGNESKKKKQHTAESESSSPDPEEEDQSQETWVPIESKNQMGEELYDSDEEEEELVDDEERLNEEEVEFSVEELSDCDDEKEQDEFVNEEQSDEEKHEFLDEEQSAEEDDEFAGKEQSDEEEDAYILEEQSDDEENASTVVEQSGDEEDAFTVEEQFDEKEDEFADEEQSDEASFQPRETQNFRNLKNMNERVCDGPNPPPPLLPDFKNCIQEKSFIDESLLIQRQLSETEVNQERTCRFFIHAGLIKKEFFTADELDEFASNNFITVKIIDPLLQSASINLRRKLMQPNVGGGEPLIDYVLESGWNDIVKRKNLEEGDIVQLWTVRVGGNLRFLLVKLPKNGGGGDSSDGNSTLEVGID